ncbi:50S ribosomal protein L25 [Rubinisphaera italica]|uniref:Large ribosomal subunit protein bL25 n=1 Tax=Rubinisphaera italica TaxID=2527969 RepID=A0A5C5XBE0_9PLAN|nr:50S ribosomal protein L25 [Rubinisphaera italica]TWT60336.1 50S ribosomal protein L25 [Rubinisphaera italica]
MSDDPKLTAQRRESLGTSTSRRMRKAGQIPGCIYGHKQEAISFAVSAEELNPIIASGHKVVDFDIDGSVDKALIQEVQWNTFSTYVQHIDLLRVDANERVSTSVEIVVRGISPGVLAGGILEQTHHELPIECPVIRLPEQIVIRVSDLKMGGAIHVSDLKLPTDCTTTLPPEEVLVHVVEPRKAPEPTDEELAASAEPEVVGAADEDADE